MKAILMSIRPQHVANILNGIKTLEIRKKFPKDYVGWVYIYCTKNGHLTKCSNGIWYNSKHGKPYDSRFSYCSGYDGKVVARFWCDKVEDFEFCEFSKHKDNLELYNECIIKDNELCKKACISCVQMVQYLDTKAIGKDMFGKAIHITRLEIFDKPKEINEFNAYCEGGIKCLHCKHYWTDDSAGYSVDRCNGKSLTRAPQSKCYVEI